MGLPFEYYQSEWKNSNLPIQLWNFRLEDYEADNASGEMAALAAEEWLDEFHHHYLPSHIALDKDISSYRFKIGKGLMFIGPNGTRKSTLACAVLTEAKYLDNRVKIYYVRFDDWLKAKKETFNKDNEAIRRRGQVVIDRAEKAGLLVLDDIGQEYSNGSGFGGSELHELARRRYEAGTPTIASTNVRPENFENLYSKSFDSFRHDAFDIHAIVGDDTRKK